MVPLAGRKRSGCPGGIGHGPAIIAWGGKGDTSVIICRMARQGTTDEDMPIPHPVAINDHDCMDHSLVHQPLSMSTSPGAGTPDCNVPARARLAEGAGCRGGTL